VFPFTECAVKSKEACKELIAKGITVNVVHLTLDGVNGK
jgi:hypothetical protein